MCAALYIALCTAAVLLISGCEKKQAQPWVPDRSALIASADGTITEVLIEHLDEDYYSASELNEMIQKEVKAYNKSCGSEAITATEMETDGSRVSITLTYASAEDYTAFNQVIFYNGSMLEAQMEGFRFEEDFFRAEDGSIKGKSISSDEPLSHKEYKVMISPPTHALEVTDEIVYLSSNAVLLTPNVAAPGSDAETDSLLYVIYQYG